MGDANDGIDVMCYGINVEAIIAKDRERFGIWGMEPAVSAGSIEG